MGDECVNYVAMLETLYIFEAATLSKPRRKLLLKYYSWKNVTVTIIVKDSVNKIWISRTSISVFTIKYELITSERNVQFHADICKNGFTVAKRFSKNKFFEKCWISSFAL